jgi:hypothetical protein
MPNGKYLTLGLVLCVSGCSEARSIPGNGEKQVEERPLDGFTRIDSSVSVPVVVTEGDTFWVNVTGDSNLIPFIETRLNGETLVIASRDDLSPRTPTLVEITLPRLVSVRHLGSGSLTVLGASRGTDLALSHRGSGRLSFSGRLDKLAVESDGSGDMVLVGHATTLQASLNGSGLLDASGLEVAAGGALSMLGSGQLLANVRGDTVLRAEGSGSIDATLNCGSATFSLAGSGTIRWTGGAKVATASVEGSGQIEHREDGLTACG